ncbi:MAG TPA: phosphoribosyltransferase [Candidatus Deferrimicrobiaceae bacterium]|jgi:predicted phosphoribosyltransferase
MPRFRDRRDAGRKLAEKLIHLVGQAGLLVAALPRGGVIVADEIARALAAPLDVLVVRKLGAPGQEELAMGAIGPGGIRVLNRQVIRPLGITDRQIEEVARVEQAEIVRRERAYRGDQPPLALSGRIVLLVDDGLATGATMRAAIAVAKAGGAARVVVAVPGAPPDTAAAIAREADEMIVLETPPLFHAVGQLYREFDQVSDAEVCRVMAEALSVRKTGIPSRSRASKS